MDVVGVGTEIVECARIARMIERHGEYFLQKVYTEREIRSCNARTRPIEHFAGLWAAKEATLKALGVGKRRASSWTEIEVRDEPGGSPIVRVGGVLRDVARRSGVGDVLVSIGRCRTHATAFATAVGPGPKGAEPGA